MLLVVLILIVAPQAGPVCSNKDNLKFDKQTIQILSIFPYGSQLWVWIYVTCVSSKSYII